ncbi:MAG: histidinol-phosphate transaminase [Verrucomicrobia bacterium]|jgi:histidinol-phosphate aminotransferase|nr:histidinol-phosphate transaminase [Verrucomicrobiota bacterium]
MKKRTHNLIRPLVRRLHAYVPGEQPKVRGLIKLNTNENPYPPAPEVLAAVRTATDARLRLYPNPTSDLLREKLARLHGCAVENIVVGNGSDDLLALATRAFVEPEGFHGMPHSDGDAKFTVQYFTPSYSLYPVLADIHGAVKRAVPLRPDFSLPTPEELKTSKTWTPRAALTFVTTPNAPSGRGYATAELEALCRAHRGVVVLDEAYVDFARENAMALALRHPHVLVSRTFSKAYSLCFQRVGYMVGHTDLIAALHKVKDSYNVNGLGQVAAVATLGNLPYYRTNFRRVIRTREALTAALAALGFEVFPSQTNFLFVRPPRFSAERWLAALRQRRILVRWFAAAGLREFLRITVGTDAEAEALVRAAKRILAERPPTITSATRTRPR